MKHLLFALTLLFGCSSGDDFDSGPCEKNETRACACPGGSEGAQTCAADGTAWGKCECEAGMAGSGGGAGTGGASGAAAKECEEDGDCPTTDKPYCVMFACSAALADGAKCEWGAKCVDGSVCLGSDSKPVERGTTEIGRCAPYP